MTMRHTGHIFVEECTVISVLSIDKQNRTVSLSVKTGKNPASTYTLRPGDVVNCNLHFDIAGGF